MFELDYDAYDNEKSIQAYLVGKRQETDAEYETRLSALEASKAAAESREKAEFERLKKKFEG